ncbi:hypothetical protein Syun_027414 [Stephania yunnanensis]|uniref:Uncharacterized protein n=1 Tax=Stephania yunnanensis TaxID=152371 RepID=A0AAP0HL12_9MAGN
MDDSSHHNSQGPSVAVSDAGYDEHLVSSMTQKLTHTSVLPANSKRCIYRVPDNLKTQNESSYVPQIVSIGPFHHGSANLQAMQDQKWIYLKSLLARRPHSSSSTGEDVSSSSLIGIAFVQSLRPLEKRASECYSEKFDKLSSNTFLEMMILDGCFIIELFVRHRLIMKKSQGREVVDVDPLFSTQRLFSYLAWDMILLENQLPLFVLEHLVSFNQLHRIDNIIGQEPSSFLKELALEFFKHRLPLPKTYFDCHVQLQHLENGSHHLLDLLRNFLLISSRSSTSDHVTIDIVKEQQEQMERSFIPSAKDLSLAGIRIKKAMDDNPLNVNFKYDRPELEIPTMSIAENLLNPLLPNLVAFEQCHSNCSTQFTSYVWFLLNIIRDDDGVKFLYKQGIIKQLPGCEEDLVLFLKKICSGVTVPRNFYFSDLYDQLNMHFGRANVRWKYAMRTYYFDNPWTIITVNNAIIVLILALVQTVFTVFTYLNQH